MPLGVIIESQANTLYERTFVGDNFTTLPKVLSALIASCDTSLGSLPLTVAMGKSTISLAHQRVNGSLILGALHHSASLDECVARAVAEEVLSVFCERYSSMMPQEQMPFVIRREQFLSFDNSCRRAFERGVASLARRFYVEQRAHIEWCCLVNIEKEEVLYVTEGYALRAMSIVRDANVLRATEEHAHEVRIAGVRLLTTRVNASVILVSKARDDLPVAVNGNDPVAELLDLRSQIARALLLLEL